MLRLTAKTRIYQASTSELYGLVQEIPQRETTPFYPRSAYGVAKLYAYWITVNYREAYGMYACNVILFNHESPRRGETFVTRKITLGLARIDAGLEECLFMGNLDSLRDWVHARDYVEMQWRMLQQEGPPEDFVIATGRQESVRRFIELAAAELGWGAICWECEGLQETGRRADTGAVVVRIDPRYFRPAEVETLLGDPTKAREKLGWTPTTTLEELVAEMVAADKEATLRREGFAVVGSMEIHPPMRQRWLPPNLERADHRRRSHFCGRPPGHCGQRHLPCPAARRLRGSGPWRRPPHRTSRRAGSAGCPGCAALVW